MPTISTGRYSHHSRCDNLRRFPLEPPVYFRRREASSTAETARLGNGTTAPKLLGPVVNRKCRGCGIASCQKNTRRSLKARILDLIELSSLTTFCTAHIHRNYVMSAVGKKPRTCRSLKRTHSHAYIARRKKTGGLSRSVSHPRFRKGGRGTRNEWDGFH